MDDLIALLTAKMESTPYPVDYIELSKQVEALFHEYCVPIELDEAMQLVITAVNLMEE
jgi:hypothetical protein